MSSVHAPLVRYDELTKPAVEPVSLDDVAAHRRLDSDDTGQDSIVKILIATARRYAEDFTGRSFIERTFRATMDGFPGGLPLLTRGGYPDPFRLGQAMLPESTILELGHGPVSSIATISYVDTSGSTQTLDSSQYVVDLSGGRCRLQPAYGAAWPATRPQLGAVRVDFTAGYGEDPEDVPEQYRHWMLVRIGTIFENREETVVVARGRIEAVPVLDSLLQFDREVVI